jgi:hypothetical protein
MTGTQSRFEEAWPVRSRHLPPVARSVSRETTFFVILLFAGLHSAVSILLSGQMLVPYVLSLVAAVGILSINVRLVQKSIAQWFLLLASFAFALALHTGLEHGAYVAALRSSGVLVYSILIGYAAFLGFEVMGRQEVERTFFWVLVVLVIGAALEVYGPIGPASDWFRGTFNTWYGLYDNDARDILDYGSYRPKFFASEPSILGLTTGFASFIWLSAKKAFSASQVILPILLVGLAFFLIRSPNVLFGPLAFLLIGFVSGRGKSRIGKLIGKLAIAACVGVVAVAPAIFLYLTLTLPNIPSYMKQLSFFERIEAPFLITADTLRSYPVLGIGLGDHDQMNELALKTFHDMNLTAFLGVAQAFDLGHVVGNVFWEYWIVFGIGGSLIFTLILLDLFRILQLRRSGIFVLAITATTFWQGFGGVNAPLAWFAVFTVAAAFNIREEPHAVARIPLQNALD